MAAPEIIHGSLLAHWELLLHGGMFMKEGFLDAANQILSSKVHRDALIRNTVITLILTLAAYDTSFSGHHLHRSSGHLLARLNERSIAFIAIRHVATAVRTDMKPLLDSIMTHIKQGLQVYEKKYAPSEELIFQCAGMLAQVVGPNRTKLLHNQFDLMFAFGLSEYVQRTARRALVQPSPLFSSGLLSTALPASWEAVRWAQSTSSSSRRDSSHRSKKVATFHVDENTCRGTTPSRTADSFPTSAFRRRG
ncbi:hypothetical protein CERSUDRAFT_99034 [Gelatoporia subvermispora B]|uniref:Uncharacterized protein n=1 Tax=Ceriporiopsis subvermispora (strain B) TaxID=914234 RepID=M2R2B2_CERS8|nr:hypothetical protein CERSUDRAFT_99034 [Gelatoporia subvermispora B]